MVGEKATCSGSNSSVLLSDFRDRMIGLPVSYSWLGHVSALCLEFGSLSAIKNKAGGIVRPVGQMGLMVEWGWRIEIGGHIACGSSSSDELQRKVLQRVAGLSIMQVDLVGSIPELLLTLSESVRVQSFMTDEGEPEWALFEREDGSSRWLMVRGGQLVVEAESASYEVGYLLGDDIPKLGG